MNIRPVWCIMLSAFEDLTLQKSVLANPGPAASGGQMVRLGAPETDLQSDQYCVTRSTKDRGWYQCTKYCPVVRTPFGDMFSLACVQRLVPLL